MSAQQSQRLERTAFWPHWTVAAVTIVILDTVTTWLAITHGLGVEGNPLVAPIVSGGDWLLLASLKLNIVLAVYLAWRTAEPGSWYGRVPRVAAALGAFIVISNTAMIVGSAMV